MHKQGDMEYAAEDFRLGTDIKVATQVLRTLKMEPTKRHSTNLDTKMLYQAACISDGFVF